MRKSLLLSAFGCVLMSAFVNASAVADVVRQATYHPIAEIHVGAKFSLDTTRIVGPPAMQDEVKTEVIQPSFVRYDGPEIIDKDHLIEV